MRFEFTAPLWEWPSRASWYFVTVPDEASADIREVPRPPRGFGSARVRVTVGGSRWTTSIFPDSNVGCYVLPIKKSVRDAEGLGDEGDVRVALELLDV
ncbi:DUF1905 domain-containing protein [Agromyces atrinae]|uniref:DUF1905 domain-containing protein n=1 Tax=Agromyces atrinae TaxID=592376 RepID=A0A4Q2M347_9MICO|nr:DUF1905 domain-containing protein [Agromyces atrinae]NYD68358.1 hypothetical protein [Agromyces atrinae]RXZ85597.1 DUF1905 domain-containing protein [Agromyces atrinae]